MFDVRWLLVSRSFRFDVAARRYFQPYRGRRRDATPLWVAVKGTRSFTDRGTFFYASLSFYTAGRAIGPLQNDSRRFKSNVERTVFH